MEKENEFGYEEKVKFTLQEIKVTMDRYEPEDIAKIRFCCDGFDITWKPKITRDSYEHGVLVERLGSMKLIELPEKIKELAQLIRLGNYPIIEGGLGTITDGDKKYYFIKSETELNKWRITSKGIVTEEVVSNGTN